jgi:hypothetical protein
MILHARLKRHSGGDFARIPAPASPQIPGVELTYALSHVWLRPFRLQGLAEPWEPLNVDK